MQPSTAARAAQSLFSLLSSLPNYGVASSSSSVIRIARTTWRDADKCFWSISKASPSAAAAATSARERATGKAWGVLTWDGREKAGTAERPVRIRGARKRVWMLVGEENEGAGGWKSPMTRI